MLRLSTRLKVAIPMQPRMRCASTSATPTSAWPSSDHARTPRADKARFRDRLLQEQHDAHPFISSGCNGGRARDFASPRRRHCAKPKDRVVAALGSDVATLDPTIYHAIISYQRSAQYLRRADRYRPEQRSFPRFATHWENSPDAKTWTFTIRTGAKFHNGDPVTIDDVIYSYQKIMDDERSPTRIHVNHIATIDRISDTQLRFNLHAPFAPFDRTASIICVISKRAYQGDGRRRVRQAPVGSGPYQVVNWIKDDRIELQAFDDWWGGAPVVKSVWMRAVPSEASRSAALLSGEVDIVPQTSGTPSQRLANRPGIKVKTGDGYKVVFPGLQFGQSQSRRSSRCARPSTWPLTATQSPSNCSAASRCRADRSWPRSASVTTPTARLTTFDPERAKQLDQGGGLSRRTNPPAVSQRLHRVGRRGGHGHRGLSPQRRHQRQAGGHGVQHILFNVAGPKTSRHPPVRVWPNFLDRQNCPSSASS